jgi:hypothetical protein
MKDSMIIVLLIVILMLLLSRRQSSYTDTQRTTLKESLRAADGAPLVFKDSLDIIINQTKGLPVLSSVNSLISKVNTARPSAQLVQYTSETQISDMFQTAYVSGESSLTKTDKAILRFMILNIIEVTNLPWGSGGLPTLSYTNDGKPLWADEVLGQTGLTIHEGIIKVMELFKEFTALTEDAVTKVNSILPSNLTPFENMDDYIIRVSATNKDPSMVWFMKFASIGPLYLLWVAENKWRIDILWILV